MVQFFSKRRLKIAEQIIIVIFFAVIIPMTVSGLIINNINQQSNRSQLRDAAVVIANIVSEEIDVFQNSINNELNQISKTIEYYNSPSKTKEYLKTIINNMSFYTELDIINPSELENFEKYKKDNNYVVYQKEMKNGDLLVAILDINDLREKIFNTINQNQRQIYVLNGTDKHLIASINYEDDIFKNSVAQLPKTLSEDETIIYGTIKNQPLAYHKKSSPNVIIIVNTTEEVARRLIGYSRDKIILSRIFILLQATFY